MAKEYVVSMQNITKSFGGVHALKKVSFAVEKGTIHALVGENGAGKSTLMKILSGAYVKDSGEIIINGQVCEGGSPSTMRRAGVGIIYQEFALAPDLTVAENIFINRMNLGKGCINWKRLYAEAEKIIHELGFNIDPRQKVSALSVAYQQIVEIAKAIGERMDILVLDEPTAVLSPYETEKLFSVLNNLRASGKSIIYISHRLEEVFQLSDHITVLRDGEKVADFETAAVKMPDVISAMLGRNLATMYPPKEAYNPGEEVLVLKNVSRGNMVQDISFSVYKGEIFGLAGLVGSGKTEVCRVIFGADKLESGEIYINGKPAISSSPHNGIKNGVSYLSESRKTEGVLLGMKIRENITMAAMKRVSRLAIFNRRKETSLSNEMMEKLSVKAPNGEVNAGDLSGGNQQKVCIAKWLFVDNDIVILDEPTRGVDIGAKTEIYQIIHDIARSGKTVIIASSELEEICGLCDRVLVMHKGMGKGILTREQLSKQNIINKSLDLELENGQE